MIGHWYNRRYQDVTVEGWGQIIEVLPNGYFLIQEYDDEHRPKVQFLATISEMHENMWDFFEDPDEAHSAMQRSKVPA